VIGARLPVEARASLVVLALFVLTAVFADLMANPAPLLARSHGTWRVLPSLTEGGQSAPRSGVGAGTTQSEIESNSWAIWAPVRASAGAPKSDRLQTRHWLGTDSRGRDVLAVTIHGTRTLVVSTLGVVVCALVVGIALGWRAAFGSPIWDGVLARLVEMVGIFPTPVLVALAVAVRPAHGTVILVGVMGVVRALEIARLLRADLLMRQRDPSLEADRLLAIGGGRLTRSWLARAAPAVLTSAAFAAASLVAVDAGLTWIGIPIDPGIASWGGLLGDRGLSGQWLPAFGSVLFTVCLFVLADATRGSSTARSTAVHTGQSTPWRGGRAGTERAVQEPLRP
jgi:peptide/nickel transport system permease protein